MAGRQGFLLAVLASGLVAQVADAAARGSELRQRTIHRNAGRTAYGSRVGYKREELLFRRQKLHHHSQHEHKHKVVHRNAMEVIHKTAYWGTVKMGTPAQEFKVIFDTGSGNLIIPSASCNMAGCDPHKKYSPKDSSTAQAVVNERGESSTEISFGTGDISGDYYKDKFCIAENLCTDVRFVAATAQSPEPFSETPFDGILGLGFKDLSMGDHFNIVDDLNANGQLPMGTFAVYLTDDQNSEITFGGYRPDQIASDVVWSKVERESYWQVGVDDITFNNVETGLCEGGCQVAVDTGTSMLAGPSDLVDKLSSKLDAKDDCSNFESLPTIGFKVKNKVLNLSPEDYMDKQSGDCSFSIMSLDVPPPKGPLFIFGDPFLRRFVTIYDRDGPRVGFAVAKHGHVDEAEAKRIISDVVGAKEEQSSLAADPKASSSVTVLNLEAGMMTRDGGSADHSDVSDDDSSKTMDESKDQAKAAESTPLTDDFSAAVDNWLKNSADGSATDSDPKSLDYHPASESAKMKSLFGEDAFIQKQAVGLRGRRSNTKLISVRLHKL